MSDALKALRWRCRRGTLELDLMLNDYLSQHYAEATRGQQQAFRDLLALEDTELMRYLLSGETPPHAEWREIVQRMRA